MNDWTLRDFRLAWRGARCLWRDARQCPGPMFRSLAVEYRRQMREYVSAYSRLRGWA